MKTKPCDQDDRRVEESLHRLLNVLSLETFGTLSNCEFDAVAFLQSLVSVADDGRIVNKHIPAGRPLDETESLLVVEPLYLALLFAHYPQTPFLQLQLLQPQHTQS